MNYYYPQPQTDSNQIYQQLYRDMNDIIYSQFYPIIKDDIKNDMQKEMKKQIELNVPNVYGPKYAQHLIDTLPEYFKLEYTDKIKKELKIPTKNIPTNSSENLNNSSNSIIEQPKQIVIEQPKIEQPKIEQPKIEQPKPIVIEQIKPVVIEQPKIEQPVIDQSKFEQTNFQQQESKFEENLKKEAGTEYNIKIGIGVVFILLNLSSIGYNIYKLFTSSNKSTSTSTINGQTTTNSEESNSIMNKIGNIVAIIVNIIFLIITSYFIYKTYKEKKELGL